MTELTQSYSERAVVFDCEVDRLIGVIAAPPHPSPVGVVIVVGGPQYRTGSHRQFVELARALAAGGHAVLRFDYRGMGDSTGALRNFESVDSDIAAAIDALLREQPSIRRVVLWGLCDGASAALMYVGATRDRRVVGLCLANPWLRSELGLARAQVKHYYTRRLMERGFWTKLLSGRVAWSAVSELWSKLGLAARRPAEGNGPGYSRRMLAGCLAFDGPLLLLYSGMDYTAKEFTDTTSRDERWRTALRKSSVQSLSLARADHTFSDPGAAAEVGSQTLRWLKTLAASTC